MAKIQADIAAIGRIASYFTRWCVWKYGPRKGAGDKPAKIPYGHRNGKALSTNRPDDWLSFDEAQQAFGGGGFDGVGVLMSGAEGVTGIDVDGCLSESGDVVPEMVEIVNTLAQWGSYIEVSPSGKGLRAFIKGWKLEDALQKVAFEGRSVEIYDDETTRYLTVTGREWGEPGKEILRRQSELESFLCRFGFMPDGVRERDSGTPEHKQRTDDEVLKLMRTHNKQGQISRLLAGDTSDQGGDRSTADLALCGEIAFFSRDPEQVDRLFRGSGLMRPKWDEMRGRSTYGARTIRAALKAQTRSFDAEKARKAAEKQAGATQAIELKAKGAEALAGGLEDLLDGKGRLRCNLYTVGELLIRDKRLSGVVYFDEFRQQPRKAFPLAKVLGKAAPNVDGDILDDDLISLSAYLGRVWGLDVKTLQVKEAVSLWARATSRNPITERLDELAASWDGKPRLATWLADYCRADTRGAKGQDLSRYVGEIGRRWLIQLVARAYTPGCKADSLLVFEGRQGARKSTAARVLCAAIAEEAFLEGFSLGGQSEQHTYMQLEGKLVVEWGELAGLSKHESERVKQFLSQREDNYKRPYDRVATKYKRTAVFIASTNEGYYLRDLTGNRRVWPVKVGAIDIERLRKDAGQIIGEAVHQYRGGARWWIDEHGTEDAALQALTAAEQAARLIPDAWDDLALDLAEMVALGTLKVGAEKLSLGPGTGAALAELMEAAGLGSITIDDSGGRTKRFAAALRKAGWERYDSGGRGKWRLPRDVVDEIERKWR